MRPCQGRTLSHVGGRPPRSFVRSALLGFCLTHGLITLVATMTISPHGGYLSIDEGTDFYLECLGIEPKWILAQRLTMDAGR